MIHPRNQSKLERYQLESYQKINHVINLDILPSRNIPGISQSNSREPKTLINITMGHGSILNGSKYLPAVIVSRAGHETSSTPTSEGVVSPGFISSVVERAEDRALRDIGGVSLGEAEGSIGVDVDLLAAGNHGVLLIVSGCCAL